MSHTNAARTEVEDLIACHPTAARLMAYPHFMGTVTTFIHQYLAFPYLRGLGWNVRQIDDDVFAAEALRRYPYFGALKQHALRAEATVKNWVAQLDLHPDFDSRSPKPDSLMVRQQKRQHGADTDCGKALAKLKATMVKNGFYRYADMTALAWRALRENPAIAERLRDRFPLVILDEAQDTNGDQLILLEHVFNDGTAFQRLGDSNQTLYECSGAGATYWTPGPSSIPLDTSRRFGADIAAFASRLTARKAQNITGISTKPASRVLFLFDETTIGNVLEAFGNEANALWGATCNMRDVWAVASRHNLTGKMKGAWQPKSLVDYHPAYRSESGTREKAHLLCRQFQKAAVHHAAFHPPAEVAAMLAIGVSGLARRYDWTAINGHPITDHNIWAALSHRDPVLPRALRRLLRDNVLTGEAVWIEAAWLAFMNELRLLFGPAPNKAEPEIANFCAFVTEQQADPTDPERRSTKHLQFGDLTLQLGSIHSVKGKSVDGILVVESEIWKGNSADQKCFDLSTVLPRAFGVTNDPFTGVALTAATNVFVGVTRPRELLGLAIRKSEAEHIVQPARDQGWNIIDLVVQQAGKRSAS
ncbi:DNA-dependent helicase II [compost metagenome]